MNTYQLGKRRAALSLILGTFALLAASAGFAQTSAAPAAPATAPAAEEPQKLEKFVVTGSFLPVSASVTASPVVTVQNSDIGMSGSTDALYLLKQLTPFFAGNGNVGTELDNGGAGESNVALRNLTTLVLVNGERLVGSANSSGTAVDLNTIPTAMIDRIEILKDGASTLYGSDAVGGVVNIILKKNYNGFEAGTRFGGTRNGDYKTRNVYIVGGVSQPGYSLTVGAQHFENTPLLTTSRPLTTLTPAGINALGFNVTSAVYSGSYAGRVNSDILAGSPLAVGAPGYKAGLLTPPAKSSPSAPPQTIAQLEAAGIYIPASTTPAFVAAGSATMLNTTLFGNPLIVNTKRNEFIANGDKELFGKSLEVYGDFIFSQTTNGGSGLAPSPIAGVGAGGANSLSIPANNPYNLFGIVIGIGQPAGAPTARTRTEELGKRSSINETNTFRFVGGLKGEINDQYSWQSDYNYSRSSETSQVLGGANGANMNTLMTPLLDASGNYVYNAAGKPLSVFQNSAGINLPVYDFFALPGFNDPQTLNAIRTVLYNSAVSNLRDIDFIVKGKPFELPAGDVAFAVGVDARVEDLTSAVDGLFANGLALGYNPASTFSGGTRSTKGIFAEVGIPLVSPKMNVPGFHTLELNVADRAEKIQPGGNANTPKFGVRWLPIDDQFVLRGTWAKGFIAPSIFALFGPASGNSPSFKILQGNGSSSAGGSLGNIVTIQGSAIQISDPALPASHSKSYTAGFVFSPKALKGLTFSMDYYHIAQDKVGSIDYTSVVADLNAKGSGSIYAQDPRGLGTGFVFADGTKLTTTAPNQVTTTNFGTISIANNPAGDQKTSGLDISLDYRFRTEASGTFDVGVSANVLFDYLFRPTSTSQYYQYARNFTDATNGLGGNNGLLPSYILKPFVSYSYKSISASMFMTYIPKVTLSGSTFGGSSKTDTDTLTGLVPQSPTYFTADVSVSYTLPDMGKNWMRNTTLMVGANNVFNKGAPYIPGGGLTESENNTDKEAYDIIGRFMFVELKKSF